MKSKKLVKVLLGCLITTLVWGCEVEQTQEGKMPGVDVDVKAGKMPEVDINVEAGKMPDVDVDVDAGQLPKYDVDAPDIVVGTKETVVEVPKIVMEKETIEVPVVGIDMPDDNDAEVNNK